MMTLDQAIKMQEGQMARAVARDTKVLEELAAMYVNKNSFIDDTEVDEALELLKEFKSEV
jgi:hypothetical protein